MVYISFDELLPPQECTGTSSDIYGLLSYAVMEIVCDYILKIDYKKS
jgi:hypothetical protein